MVELAICRVYPTDVIDDVDQPERTGPTEFVRLALSEPPPGANCTVVDFMPELLNFGPLRRYEQTVGILLQPRADRAPLQWSAKVQLNLGQNTGTVWILDDG